MIDLNQYVEIVLSGSNIKYYKEKGYDLEKFRDEKGVLKGKLITVSLNDVPLKSQVLVSFTCDYCDTNISIKYSVYNSQKEKSLIKKDACCQCKNIKSTESNRNRIKNDETFNIDNIKIEFENRNMTLLSTKYINTIDKLEYICNSHPDIGVQNISYGKFKSGQGCKHCHFDKLSVQLRLSYDFILSQFDNMGYKLLTSGYINSQQKLEYICLKHEDKGIQNITYASISGGHGCYYCSLESRTEIRKHSYDFVKSEFEKRDYTLIDNAYVNSAQKLKYICNKHQDFTQEITYCHLHSGQGCYYCARERVGDSQRHSYDFVKSEFQKRDYTLISDKYVNCSEKLVYYCNKHPMITQEITYTSLNIGNGCSICGFSKGERLVYNFINESKMNFQIQYKTDECKNVNCLPFDFAIFYDNLKSKLKLLIEVDGEQHFKPVNFGGISDERSLENFKKTKMRDQIKNEYCINNNIPLLRIPYWDMKNTESIIENYILELDNQQQAI